MYAHTSLVLYNKSLGDSNIETVFNKEIIINIMTSFGSGEDDLVLDHKQHKYTFKLFLDYFGVLITTSVRNETTYFSMHVPQVMRHLAFLRLKGVGTHGSLKYLSILKCLLDRLLLLKRIQIKNRWNICIEGCVSTFS